MKRKRNNPNKDTNMVTAMRTPPGPIAEQQQQQEPQNNDGNDDDMEWVLLVPPRQTKSAYATLVTCECVFRPWHLEGRFGSRTHPYETTIAAESTTDTNTKTTKKIGIPVLSKDFVLYQAKKHPELQQLLQFGRTEEDDDECVEFVYKKFVPSNRAIRNLPFVDATIHPERAPSDWKPQQHMCSTSTSSAAASFTYMDLFAGMGGFAVALDALGGHCILASEVDSACQRLYRHNFPTAPLVGDIYEIRSEQLQDILHNNQNGIDLLVGGFPCQPFSAMGEQPGLKCPKGTLFLEIVRLLQECRPRAFLLENVPGLLTMKDTFAAIVNALQKVGYDVTYEVCNARGVTATNRKRLFLVGIQNQNGEATGSQEDADDHHDNNNVAPTTFEFPFVPDLQLKARDVIDDTNQELTELERQLLPVTDEQLQRLNAIKKWKPADLAWPNTVCDTLVSHYGNAVARGETQLVPCSARRQMMAWHSNKHDDGNDQDKDSILPNTNPRRFSPRECIRIMGFPNSYQLPPKQKKRSIAAMMVGDGVETNSDQKEESQEEQPHEQSDRAFLKEQYRMAGNAVCPPLIAALAGAVLDHVLTDAPPPTQMSLSQDATAASDDGAPVMTISTTTPATSWTDYGRQVAIDLACRATRTGRPMMGKH